ncbi:unnamed protein product [Leuciscus chuanchicus]
MAPVLSACRQLLPARLLFYLSVFLLLSLWHCADALVTYDRSILLHIQNSLELQSTGRLGPHSRCHPMFINSPMDCVRRLSCCISHRKKRRRKRGNRGGVRVRIRGSAVSILQRRIFSIDIAGGRSLHLARRSWDLRYTCHIAISPARSSTLYPAAPPRLRIRSGGVNSLNIHPLQRSQSSQPLDYFTTRAALLNCSYP